MPTARSAAVDGFHLAYDDHRPAGTPSAVLDRIRADVRALLADTAFVERQVTMRGFVVVAGDGALLRRTIRDETAIAAEQIKAAGIVPE